MGDIERIVIGAALVVGLGVVQSGSVSAEGQGTGNTTATSSQSVDSLNLDGSLTSGQAETVARHPREWTSF